LEPQLLKKEETPQRKKAKKMQFSKQLTQPIVETPNPPVTEPRDLMDLVVERPVPSVTKPLDLMDLDVDKSMPPLSKPLDLMDLDPDEPTKFQCDYVRQEPFQSTGTVTRRKVDRIRKRYIAF
jgi:hypothetical protein